MALDAESFDILLATVQRFVRERLVPAENQVEEHDEVPAEMVEEMKEMGLFGLTMPEEYGGIGLSVSQEVPGRLRARPAPRRPSARCSAPTSASARRAS